MSPSILLSLRLIPSAPLCWNGCGHLGVPVMEKMSWKDPRWTFLWDMLLWHQSFHIQLGAPSHPGVGVASRTTPIACAHSPGSVLRRCKAEGT